VIRLEGDGRAGEAPPTSAGSPFESRLRELLSSVARGEVTPSEAAESLRDLPFTDLGFAKVDHHRELRQGTTEIVYARGKTVEEVRAIVDRLLSVNDGPVLVTRADPSQLAAVRTLAEAARLPVREAPRSGALAIVRGLRSPAGLVMVATGGTSDLPVAEEAVLTASVLGAEVELIADVGVAGLHRIVAHQDRLAAADVVIVVAGMEGALASVVGGLAACPVIACPTSVGYGASFGGLAALLSMLSSCAPGVVCVNIDDGVGAGYAAGLIARQASGSRPS
jgi:NCAIR mutase (PurE)-related protein